MTTKVLYVVGTQRGGTTIAGRLIGELGGFAFVGELRKLWQVGIADGRTCGCGSAYGDCDVWSAVVPPMLAATGIDTIQGWQRAAAPDRRSSLQAWRLARQPAGSHGPAVRSYASLLSTTYAALAAATGARVIVDTSKLPADAVLVTGLDDIDPYIVQLVRDPRGTVSSTLARSGPGKRRHPRQALAGSSGWLVRHLAGRALRHRVGADRSRLVTYEDLLADPESVLADIAALVGEPEPADPVVVDGRAELGVAHTPIGNGRFRPESVALTHDERWMTALGRADRLIVSTVTRPLARSFGYRFSATRGLPCSPSRQPGA